ncbi:MAG: CCA tRNA nucleotidyltransferase [Lachnospiraceae bacterium]|nr:CCA tRNA nucleotidyltransferase [Lachnospiraceae bacterium]
MHINVPREVSHIIQTLTEAGYEAYAVGGCIRDSLLRRIPSDWDITTSATPAQVKELFGHTIDTGIAHGTVTVMRSGVGYEITTYRIDGEYEDGRHPKQVTFTASLREDLRRRDFTINAMAYNETEGLIDLFGGMEDLENGVIRAVGEPMERFSEDALRMMRAVRFAAQLDFAVEEKTAEAICNLARTLQRISAERIQTELVKLLVSPHPEKIRLLYEYGLTAVFLPEFDAAMKQEQHNPHHAYTVGVHTIESLRGIENDRVLRLTMLFHDLGKPACHKTDEQGIDHFKGHPEVSTKIAQEKMRALKFDRAGMDRVERLIRAHDIRIEPTKKAVRKLMSRLGEEEFFLLLKVQDADIHAQSDYLRKEKLERQQEVKRLAEEIVADGECISLRTLEVGGKDLMEIGFEKGPSLGGELARLLEAVLEEPSLNEYETLMTLAKKHLAGSAEG